MKHILGRQEGLKVDSQVVSGSGFESYLLYLTTVQSESSPFSSGSHPLILKPGIKITSTPLGYCED